MTEKYRKLYQPILKQLKEKEYTIITGARQTGKTTILKQLKDNLLEKGENVYYITLEDPAILNVLNNHPENIFQLITLPKIGKAFVLIDEVQYLKAPSNFMKLIYDQYAEKIKIVATGSSAFYLDSKFKDSMAGRKKIFELYTLDFEEFLVFKNPSGELVKEWETIRNNNHYKSLRRREILTLYEEYLTFGGYPAVVLKTELKQKQDLLLELLNSYIKRDMLESNVQNEDKFFQLIVLLANQSGNLLNINELSNTLQLSVTGINNYVHILQKCFHIHLVKPFHNNIRKELTKMPKVYFNDLGLRNIILKQFLPVSQRIDKGELIENYTFTRLRSIYGKDAINYWRTSDGNEIDFIVTESYNNRKAIEVKFSERMFKASKYNKFTSQYPDIPLQLKAYDAIENKNSIIAL
jgi:predicted AAA+ superfamily ATPase